MRKRGIRTHETRTWPAHFGAETTPEGIVTFAQRAEELGFDSLWVLERLLRPLAQAGSFHIPDYYANVFAPVETLTYVSAHTKTIRLGTSVIDALSSPPGPPLRN
jgi:alkanesulfonate monooxygenase SsuD/methylene tetrahydromethanopterin reductase-like flavin-dependent oxidoreductase (luciferase family)